MSRSKRPFVSTSVFAILGRSGGFFIPVLTAYFFGASLQTDAFFLAFGIVMLIVQTFNHLLESVLVPYLSEEEGRADDLSKFSNGVLTYSFLGVCICFGMFWIGLDPFLTFVSGFKHDFVRTVVNIFVIMSPLILLGVWISIANGVFYVYKVFWYPAFSPLVRSLIVIGFLFLGHRTWGIYSVAWGFAAGEVIRWILTVWLLYALTPWRPYRHWSSMAAKVKLFFNHAVFQTIALVAFNLFLFTDSLFATWLGAGAVSLLSYADRLFYVPYQLFLVSFVTIYHSDWSQIYCQESNRFFWGKIQQDVKHVFILTGALAVFCWLLKDPLVRLTLFRGNIDEREIKAVVDLFGWMAVGFIPAVIKPLFDRVLFVLKKSMFYLIYSWILLLVKLAANYIFMQFYGLTGIVVSTVVVNALCVFWFYFYLQFFLNRPIDDSRAKT